MKQATVNIPENIKEILQNSKVEGKNLTLPQTLSRDIYLKTNQIIELLGGKWNRKLKCHVFDKDIKTVLDDSIETGLVVNEKKTFQFYETPDNVIEKLLDFARLSEYDVILEPSAGRGKIISKIRFYKKIDMCEINPKMVLELQKICNDKINIVGKDFLKYCPSFLYDKIIANPPFTGNTDIEHISHMIDLLKEGGILTTVCPCGILERDNKKADEFRQKLKNYSYSTYILPSDSFVESGTRIATAIITVKK